MKIMVTGLAGMACTAAALPAIALAQDQAASARRSDDSGMGEIVVTARRRAEPAQSVPIALSAVSSAEINASGGLSDLSRVQQLVPSLQLTIVNPRNTNINIRGLGSTPAFSAPGLEYGVGIYVDQVYISRPGQSAFDLFDLQQVEVLRGPQGTLFGKNTTAGAINITTLEPSFDADFKGELSYGNYDFLQARATGSVPIVPDAVALRVSVTDAVRDKGFQFNRHTGRRIHDYSNQGVRGQLLVVPSDDVRIRLIGDYSVQDQDCCIGVPSEILTTRIDGSELPNNFNIRAARAGYDIGPIDPFARVVDADTPLTTHMTTAGVSGQIDWTIGTHTLTSVTAWRKWDYFPETDADVIGLSILPRGGVDERQRQFSQELRLASDDTGALNYVLGLYYFHQKIDSELFIEYGPDAPLWILGASTPALQAALAGVTSQGLSTAKTNSYAGFAQGSYKFGDVSMTLGLRYTHEKKSGDFSQAPVGGADLSLLPEDQQAVAVPTRNAFIPVVAFDAGTSEGNLSGLATLSWQPTPDIMAYATYSRGYKSGGINLAVLPEGVSAELKPEKADNYEVGLKTSLFDRRVTANLAAFWVDVKDYQSSQIDTSRALVAYLDNVGSVRSRGVEADIRAAPARGLAVYASGAYVDAEYRSYPNAPCPIEYLNLQTVCDLGGRPLPGTSKWSISAGGSYAFDVGGYKAEIGGDYSYRSSYYSAFNLAEVSRIDGFSLVNMRVGLTDEASGIGLQFWVRNLFDKKYETVRNIAAFNTGLVTSLLGDPRTYGVTATGRF